MSSEDYRPSLDDPNAWVPYRYHPSLAAAIAFTVVFGLVTLAQGALTSVRRVWYFTPFTIGGIFEIIGYIGRTISTNDLWALGPYIVQSILLLIAPAFFAAAIYIVLGRIIRFVDGERHSLIRLKWLTKIFVTGDVAAFLLQMAGGGIQAGGTLSLMHLGEKIIIVGLFAQVVFFGLFVVVASLFHYRFTRHDASQLSRVRDSAWRRHIHALYWGSGLIMFRSIFRVVEYLMGNNGFLLRHEYFLYIFDAVPMFLLMVLFLIIHPSQLTALEAGSAGESAGNEARGRKWYFSKSRGPRYTRPALDASVMELHKTGGSTAYSPST
ncbi:uncharacterized protein CLAFUR5_11018 [Fulvia fulva]|uniref:RTA1-domain-containing protein n=1 Tax=Passalora fulva TaxID=5499 RepID=A0A9Q8PF82_PASFU|nr:uncharacterized protein CLAFUR5_11018 [Fulvia fulva]KAK4618612.1 hypothetical protein CLAFUR0_11993 [Fulvia fulva]UJO21322.1 hypothetical protein CLAFUR5_11018 [Fulvia fulva]WPV33310.1 hypothetical protein CLAFUW7_11984 [Fulvia fulva]